MTHYLIPISQLPGMTEITITKRLKYKTNDFITLTITDSQVVGGGGGGGEMNIFIPFD